MAEWFSKAAAAHSELNANKTINDTIATRKGARTKQAQEFNWTSNITVVGIDANKVPQMALAIEDYIKRVKQHLDGIQPNANANHAYQGEGVQKAIEDYVNKTKEYCFNLTSQLRAFEDKLYDVKKAYDDNRKQMVENINATSGTYAEGSEYKSTVVGTGRVTGE